MGDRQLEALAQARGMVWLLVPLITPDEYGAARDA